MKKIVPTLKPRTRGVVGMLAPNKDSQEMLDALASTQPAMPAETEIRRFSAQSDQVAELQIGRVYELPLNVLEATENNARVFYNQQEVDDIAESMAKNGQDVPAVGYVRGEKVVIVDGQKRLNGCVAGKLAVLRVLIRVAPQDDSEEYEASRRINKDRSTQNAFDDAIRWKSLLDRNAYTSQDHLAQRLNVSKSTVSKTLGLTRIPQHLRRLMADHPQTSTLAVAYEISAIFADVTDESQEQFELLAEEVVQLVQKKSLGRDQTAELVQSRLRGPKSRIRGETAPITFGSYKGTLKIVPEKGVFNMSFTGLKEDDLKRLQTLAQSILS
jgi:ParB family chromosome partitioning protein